MNTIENYIEEAIKNYLVETIDEEIEKETQKFYYLLTARKDKYIADIMSSIRIMHEANHENMYDDYRIMFINKYEINTNGDNK